MKYIRVCLVEIANPEAPELKREDGTLSYITPEVFAEECIPAKAIGKVFERVRKLSVKASKA